MNSTFRYIYQSGFNEATLFANRANPFKKNVGIKCFFFKEKWNIILLKTYFVYHKVYQDRKQCQSGKIITNHRVGNESNRVKPDLARFDKN